VRCSLRQIVFDSWTQVRELARIEQHGSIAGNGIREKVTFVSDEIHFCTGFASHTVGFAAM
jgi:hypothetical protein